MLGRIWTKGGAGAKIRFTIVNSPLDRMLVASTTQGVCAVAFGADDASLVAELRGRFAKAELRRDEAALASGAQAVLRVLHGEPLSASGLELHVQRTAFQERAWEAMQAIPRGDTLTYGDLAEKIGSARAAIAVGGACSRNPVAILIPCHRVLARGGKMHNWRWGVERKERLLAMEKSRGAGTKEAPGTSLES